MPSHSQKVRLGVFIIMSSISLIAILIVIGSKQFFQEKDIYYISYKNVSVSGLEVGSPVKYLGISVGTIKEIKIDPKDVSRIIVTVALEPGTPIKKDARAEIAAIGITGLKMIEIRGGSNEAQLLNPEQFIQPGSSITEEITGKAEIIAEKMEAVLNNLYIFTQPDNLNKITILAESSTSMMDNLNNILVENRGNLRATMIYSEAAMARLDTISMLLQESSFHINRMATSDTMAQILSNVRDISQKLKQAQLEELIRELGEVVDRTNRLLTSIDHDMEQGSKDFLVGMKRLKTILDNLNETSQLVNEDPSVLIWGTSLDEVPDEALEED